MTKRIEGYRIFMTKLLGSGSYGKVYLGQQDNTELKVAIKVLPKSSINSDPYLKAALFSQIKIMKMIKSPNVVALYEVLQSPNNYYIVEELCQGDLEHLLKKSGNLSEKASIKLLTEICNGFLPLIRQGILHRDLKPANIFLVKGQAKIGDFGFAKKQQNNTMMTSAVGTPLYSPVELLKNEPYTSKCDIWAIGFMFYQMLHGKTPWTANSPYELPLKMAEQLDKNTKDFLTKTLGATEAKRIGWDELYYHPIFEGCFLEQVKNHAHLQNKYKKVMADIRFQVNSQNIDLKKFWNDCDYDSNKQLDETEFRKFLGLIVPQLQKSQEDYFFSKLDTNKDGNISLKELEKEFQANGIPLTAKFTNKIPFLMRHVVSSETQHQPDKEEQIDLQLENKVRSCFQRLQNSLKKKNLTLYKVFVAYDDDHSGQFSLKQFNKVMKKLDNSFENEQIEIIFDLIDENKSKTISFTELNKYYSKINGIPEALNVGPEANFFKK